MFGFSDTWQLGDQHRHDDCDLLDGLSDPGRAASVGAPMASSKRALELELGVLFGMTDATADVTGEANVHFTF